jgi:uncharacterized protein (DUF2147 family)
MKKTIYTLLLFILSNSLFAQQANDILGQWLNEEGDAKVEIFNRDGEFFGKIVWLKEPKHENGEWKLDDQNPDESLRHRRKLGLEVMHNLVWDEKEKEWNEGKIYDAREGDTYSLYAKLGDNNTLNLRGYIGFSLFGRTTTWTRQ